MTARPPLDVERLRRRLVRSGEFVSRLDVVESTVSTNADLIAAAAAGAPSGAVLVAEYQRAGRGRFDRSWSVPPRAGLLLSVLVRPSAVPSAQWGWLPLLAGLAVRAAVAPDLPAESARLKWPNDLLIGSQGRKAAGILVQASGAAAVIGVGLNVDQSADELPVETAISLRMAAGGDHAGREDLLCRLLAELAVRYAGWAEAAGDPVASGLRAEYERHCDTLGRSVSVDRTGGAVHAVAHAIDADGSLIVESGGRTMMFAAGDVVHLRGAAG